MLDALEARSREMLGAIEHPRDRASWARAVPRLRQELRTSLGLDRLPAAGARHLHLVGTLDRGSYRLEKWTYETLPGVEVPAHLYVPNSQGRHPAILFVPGHWYAESKTKTDFQAFAIAMARWGFVVLEYDPIGQGERGISLRDHRRTELLAVGVAQEAIVVFETLSALEFLLSRTDVDPERIGMTGASGGGYNSWIVPSLDPRIAVTVPVVGTSDFLEQLRAVRERDWYDAKEHCHFVPGLFRFANNHEFLAMVAPRPLLIIAAHHDESFPIPGNRVVAEYGTLLYRALGAEGRLGYSEDERDGHGYQKKKREAAYGWFLKWLKGEGDGSPVPEPLFDVPPPNAPELRCFPPGENRPAGPGLVSLAASLLRDRAEAPEAPGESLLLALGLAGEALAGKSPTLERAGGERVSWTSSEGLRIPGLLLAPSGSWTGALLAAGDGGKETLREHPVVREALGAGMGVFLCDIRGTGELATRKPGWTFAVSLLLGENFVGRQAIDLVSGVRVLCALPELRGKPIALFGSGPFSSLAALYASVLERHIQALVMEGGFASYRDFVERPRTRSASYRLLLPGEEGAHRVDREIPAALIPFGVLGRFDLPDLQAALRPRPVRVLSTLSGDFDLIPGPGAGLREFFPSLLEKPK
ncbi:MAG TPA: prolyl oligopeptidase family serine peptidase [Planctomycetota bacterium]|nr:prolyl oligopeptidase family serine peptidase [Planctomycetota bacterium]